MDFAALKKKLADATAPLMEKAAPLMEKAKDAGFKAIDFTQKQLQNTPIALKTIDEYKDFLTKKRAIIIAYNETDPSVRDVLMRIPLWSAKAWSDAAELRLIEISKESELGSYLAIQTSIDMRVSYIGEETFHGTDVTSILKWWESPCYDGKCDPEPGATEQTSEHNNKEEIEMKPIQPEEVGIEATPSPVAPKEETQSSPEMIDPLAGK